MKILHVLNNLDRGGAEMYTLRLATHLGALGHQNVLAYTRGGALVDRFVAANVGVHRFGRRPLNFRSFGPNLAAVLHLARLARETRADVMHAHVFEAYVWASWASKISGVPLYRTVVANRLDAQWWSPPVERFMSRRTRHLISLTRTGHDELVAMGVADRKIATIPNGVDPSWFDTVPESERESVRSALGISSCRIIGTVGRLHWHKNQKLLLKAAPIVLERCPDAKFVIDGEGAMRSELEALRDTLGLSDNILFTGMTPDVRRLMSAFDIFVLPSVTEGSPTVVLEAMALGIPVLATAVGGVPDVIADGGTGLLVPSGNERRLAEGICRLLSSREEARRIGRSGKAWCKANCDFRIIAQKVARLYAAGR